MKLMYIMLLAVALSAAPTLVNAHTGHCGYHGVGFRVWSCQ